MKKKIVINIVMTCHNRKDSTINCIKSLLNQKYIEKYELNFYICDDGCTDGTVESIKKIIPYAKIVKGDGNLFWAKGMAKALNEAKKYSCDFYLMVNDDVLFYETMLEIMFRTYNFSEDINIAVSGATQSSNTLEYTYGGEKIVYKGIIKEKSEKVLPQNPPKMCDRANWNCFLISSQFFEKIGDIDNYYEHSLADYDYSNRIILRGGKIYISIDYVGICNRNSIENTWRDKNLPVKERLEKLESPNGNPIRSSIHYWRKFDKKLWILRVIRPYLSIVKDGIKKIYGGNNNGL